MTDAASRPVPAGVRGALNGALASKVPQVTVFFWIIKILCTTVGETASDFLSVKLGLGLKGTSVAAGVCLAVVLFVQFRAKRYIPGVYWLAVVLVSVFGTLITDILTDSLHFPLEASTVIFSVALGLTFGAWYAKERTLSIHSIFTARAGGLLLAGHPLHVRAGDRDGRSRRGEARRRVSRDRPHRARRHCCSGHWNGAKSRAADLESAWDDGQARMQPMNPDKWTQMDNAIDGVLKKTRASSPDAAAALQALLGVTDSLDHGNETP